MSAPDTITLTLDVRALAAALAEHMGLEREPPGVLVDTNTLASMWRCSPRTIRKFVAEGLPTVHIGSDLRYVPDEALAWLRARDGEKKGR